MCRKFAYLTLGIAVALVVLSFTTAGSYMRTYCCQLKGAVSQSVPIEFEIQRLKQEAERLTPELKRNMTIVANETAAIDRMEKEIGQVKDNLGKQKATLLQMTKDLDSGATEFVSGQKVYNRGQLTQKLALDFESYKRAEAESQTRQQVLAVRRQKLEIARTHLSEMKNQEEQLKLTIAQLETDLQLVRLAQVKNNVEMDDSRLSQVKRSIADLQERINAERIRAELDAEFFPNRVTTVEPTAPRPAAELIQAVREHLNSDQK